MDLEFAEEQARRAAPDPETAAFVEVVSANLPTGDDLTAAELRVDYLLEKLAEEHGRLGHLCEFSDRRVLMVREHQATEAGKIERRCAWLEKTIREHLPFDAPTFWSHYGAKSHRLPHGTYGYRSSRATVEIEDMEKAVAFARRRSLEIKTVHTVGKTPLMEHVVRDGEEPDPETDGFRFVPASDEFFCKPEGI